MPQSFASRSQQRASMKTATKHRLRKQIIAYYRALYEVTYGQNGFMLFLGGLFSPPFTYAKAATYGLAMVILSTGVYAGVNPAGFERTAAVVKQTVQSAVQASVKTLLPSRASNPRDDIREEVDEVFCDGEWRDLADCVSVGGVFTGSGNDEQEENDIREDANEEFCDGKRRDPADCAKRALKKSIKKQQQRFENNIRGDDDTDDDTNNRNKEKNEVRENKDEVFCDGERRDPADCKKRVEKDEDDSYDTDRKERSDQNDEDDEDEKSSEDYHGEARDTRGDDD